MNTRRNFLKITGTGITGALLSSINSGAAKLDTKGQKIKIGVLLPNSVEHPQYPGAFLNGLRLGIDQQNAIKKNKIELVTESVNFGTPFIVKEKIQKLMTENNVDLITGVINSEVATHVGSLFKNAQMPAIIANAGESYLVNDLKQNPFVFFNSLNLFQAAFESGKYAVKNFGKNIAVVSSFYDSGYDSLFTFRLGVEAAGGTVTETYISSQNDKKGDVDIIEKLETAKPDGIYVFMHGRESDDFIRNIHFRKLDIPVITTGFSTEENRLVNLGDAAVNVISIASWSKNIASKENKSFAESYRKSYNKTPDLFSVLGYETGQIIYDSLARCSGNFKGTAIAEAMKSCKVQSPRGEVAINAESGLVQNKLFVSQTKMSLFSIPENELLETIIPVSEFDESFAVLDNEYRTGWLNPYLFV